MRFGAPRSLDLPAAVMHVCPLMNTQNHTYNVRFRRLGGRLRALGLALALLPSLLVLSACASPFPGATTGDEQNDAIRVVSWNIEWFPGRSPHASEREEEEHRLEVAEYLPGLHPDILLLQEIRTADAAEFLVDAVPGLELHVVTALERPDPTFAQQLVIASRYPALAGFAEVFTDIYDDDDTEPYRGYAFAAIDWPRDGIVLVYSVHLKSNRGESSVNIATREASAKQILNHIGVMKEHYAEHGPITVIVGGDFNLLLEREEMAHERTLDKFLEAGFHWTWDGVPFRRRVTWPADGRFGDACFDHIVTYGLPALTARVLHKPEGELSDHRPVLLRVPLDDE